MVGPGAAAVGALDEIARRLRRDCPWDREQDARSIVSHTVEEAYELADAAYSGDDAKLLDELGDVLFQVHFLALMLEERGSGDLAAVAEHCVAKLVRRHPHVFGQVEVDGAADVLRNWDQIKRGEEGRGEGIFGELPDNLPSPIYARKVQRRAAGAGRPAFVPGEPLERLEREAARLGSGELSREQGFEALGELLFAAVGAARELEIDPELALRAAADRLRRRTEAEEAKGA